MFLPHSGGVKVLQEGQDTSLSLSNPQDLLKYSFVQLGPEANQKVLGLMSINHLQLQDLDSRVFRGPDISIKLETHPCRMQC